MEKQPFQRLTAWGNRVALGDADVERRTGGAHRMGIIIGEW